MCPKKAKKVKKKFGKCREKLINNIDEKICTNIKIYNTKRTYLNERSKSEQTRDNKYDSKNNTEHNIYVNRKHLNSSRFLITDELSGRTYYQHYDNEEFTTGLRKFIENKFINLYQNTNEIPETLKQWTNKGNSPDYINMNDLSIEIKKLEYKIDQMEWDTRKFDAFIYGIPYIGPNENLKSIVIMAFSIAKCNIMNCIHRSRITTWSTNKIPPISLKFNSSEEKLKFVSRFNKAKATLWDFGEQFGFPKQSLFGIVYSRESLTSRNREIFQYAKMLKHGLYLENVFIKNGEIFVQLKGQKLLIHVIELKQLVNLMESADKLSFENYNNEKDLNDLNGSVSFTDDIFWNIWDENYSPFKW